MGKDGGKEIDTWVSGELVMEPIKAKRGRGGAGIFRGWGAVSSKERGGDRGAIP